MDPSQSAVAPGLQPIPGYLFAPGIFLSETDSQAYLSSLDSDTRDYVLKHMKEFRSKRDIEDCIIRLRSGS